VLVPGIVADGRNPARAAAGGIVGSFISVFAAGPERRAML
jgi:hypothetical protein